MRIKQTNAGTVISIIDEKGVANPEQIFIPSGSGSGKSIFCEAIAEEYQKCGYNVIFLTDPKDSFEFCYASMKPKEKYHLDILKRQGAKPQTHKVDIFHPFTFNIPKHRILPEIDFFTLPLKEIGRDELSMLFETPYDSSSINLVLEGCKVLPKNAGLYELMQWIQEKARRQEVRYGDKKFYRPDKGLFFLDSSMAGTMKDVGDIGSHFKSFDNNYFLAPENCPFNLDFKNRIFKNQDRYKVLTTKWIPDEKIKDFAILFFYNMIMKNIDYAKHPILFILEEIRFLCPRPDKVTHLYKTYLAKSLRDKYSTMRSKGRGCGSISTTQVYFDVDPDIADSSTVTLIGNLGGTQDIERFWKALRYNRETYEILNELGRNEFLFKKKENMGAFKGFFPKHRHAEIQYKFVEEYAKEFPGKMKKYDKIYDLMKDIWKEDMEKIKGKVKERFERQKRLAIEEYKRKKESESEGKKEKKYKERFIDLKDSDKRKKMEDCYNFYMQMDKKSFRAVGREFTIHYKTAQRYIEIIRKEKESNPIDLEKG